MVVVVDDKQEKDSRMTTRLIEPLYGFARVSSVFEHRYRCIKCVICMNGTYYVVKRKESYFRKFKLKDTCFLIGMSKQTMLVLSVYEFAFLQFLLQLIVISFQQFS